MKAKELRGMTSDELAGMLRDNVEDLYNLRFQKATDRMESPGRMKAVRRDVARIKTIMHERGES